MDCTLNGSVPCLPAPLSRHPLLELQQRAMARQREEWLVAWEKARRVRERRAARMWQQGYHEQDIERTLGPQQDVSRGCGRGGGWGELATHSLHLKHLPAV